MSIIYALIAREDNSLEYGANIHVLTEASPESSTGNFPQVTREIVLPGVPKNQKSLYNFKDKYIFHMLNEGGFTYLCLADNDYSKTRAHVFLEEVKIAFCKRYPPEQREVAISYGLNSFAEVILEKMAYYNQNKLDPKLANIKNEAGRTLGIMEQNLESIMERGDKIELLVRKASTLNVESGNLKQRSAILKEQARNAALKRTAIIGAVVLFIVYLAFAH